jgi:RND family efflux transporter MFP subunit
MEQDSLYRLVRTLNALTGPAAGLSDAQLLERFVTRQDEAAFELLLWRHGAMVLGICRRMLHDSHDAEDVFQATFLVLARKAASIARAEAVGAWLARVACRVALRARAQLTRQARCERLALDDLAAPPAATPEQGDLRRVLDEEIDRLPARQRAVVVLCCLEGKTGEQAARELGCAPGTVSSRLTRARDRLRRRLARRGLAPADRLPGQLPEAPRTGSLLAPLVSRALDAALTGAAHTLPGRAVAYAEGVLRAMLVNKLKNTGLLALLLAGILVVGGLATHHALSAGPEARAESAEPEKDAKARSKGPAARTAVQVVKPQEGGLRRAARMPCAVQPFDQEEVFPAVSGTLKSLDVDIGDRVKKGQLLGVIDAPLLAIAEKEAAVSVRLARGQAQQEQARLATLKREVEVARSVVTLRKAEADAAKVVLAGEQKKLQRFKELLEAKAIEQRLVEEKEQAVQAARAQAAAATAAVGNAAADLEVKKSKVGQGEAALATARAQVELAELALEKARHAAGLTRVVAAFDGVVTERSVRAGHRLQGGESRRPMLTIQRTDRVRVVADVAESDALLARPGVEADVAFSTSPDDALRGRTISRVGYALDPKTQTMRVEIDVDNPRGQFRPGASGAVTLHLGKATPGALRLPLSCLAPRSSSGDNEVYVVRDGKGRRTPVRLGNIGEHEVEIVSGLKATDQVVADPSRLTADIVPVEVKERRESK